MAFLPANKLIINALIVNIKKIYSTVIPLIKYIEIVICEFNIEQAADNEASDNSETDSVSIKL